LSKSFGAKSAVIDFSKSQLLEKGISDASGQVVAQEATVH
jgi:hypothetical protein